MGREVVPLGGHHPDKGVGAWGAPTLQSCSLKCCLKSAHLPALEG